MMSLWQGEKQLYAGDCGYSLAYILINEIIYQTIVDNYVGYAIHAAAIRYGEGGMLIPGKSGCGKSTLITWLVSRGANYLTDELVIISSNDHCIYPFTRPITLKSGSSAILSSFLSVDWEKVLTGKSGFMLPHRLVNKNYSIAHPPLSHILFVEYKADESANITRLTGAEGCLRLMACYVNENHGISKIAALVRNTPIFQLSG